MLLKRLKHPPTFPLLLREDDLQKRSIETRNYVCSQSTAGEMGGFWACSEAGELPDGATQIWWVGPLFCGSERNGREPDERGDY